VAELTVINLVNFKKQKWEKMQAIMQLVREHKFCNRTMPK